MPVTTVEAMRDWADGSFSACISRAPSDTNRAAPKLTRALVRSPAGCWPHCRSRPIARPRPNAVPVFARKSSRCMAAAPQTTPPGARSPGGRDETRAPPGADGPSPRRHHYFSDLVSTTQMFRK